MPEELIASIIIPCYNEESTLRSLMEKVFVTFQDVPSELILVNDGSKDNTHQEIEAVLASRDSNTKYPEITYLINPINIGKTPSISRGISCARGKYVAIQDADLEYDPSDLKALIMEAHENNYPAIYGSRNLASNEFLYRHYQLGGVFITKFYNLLFGDNITDLTTCYKIINAEMLKRFGVTETGFGFCPEVTCKLNIEGVDIIEKPIKYSPRSMEEGKKIRSSVGIQFLWIILKNFVQGKISRLS